MIIKEWEDQEKYNSFNSYKGLMYKQWYDAILEGKFLPPIEASVDPVNACNLRCLYCNGFDVWHRNKIMDIDHLLDLVRFFKSWGVKAMCIAGGGEPTLQPKLYKAINLCGEIGLPVAIITNGTLFNDKLVDSMSKWCRWVGISVDASTKETFLKLKGVDLFDTVKSNIKKLTKAGCREVTYKYLLHPYNQHEVYKAIELARDLGCNRIHIRPVSFMNYQNYEENYDISSINEQVLRGRAIYENDNFKVFYVQHKYNKDLHRKFGFTKCRATPIMPIFHANGDISLCIDRKADPGLVIGSHVNIEDIPKVWGSAKHKEVIDNIKLNECPKCTLQHCNEQIEYAVIQDKMDWMFT